MIGQSIAHYRIVEKLGEGGMGAVYKALDTHLDRFVALKLLPPEATADPERKRRFVQEAKAASALNHPNIITIHDIGSDGGADFIAMEYVAGKPLDELIGRRGLPVKESLAISIQIAGGLSAAHAAGIVHRDVKPGNVMVTDNGLVKILDFGLAKLSERIGSEMDLTRTEKPVTGQGAIVGTVAYMSPEQAEGLSVDARSDIFSFGSVLYEMVTGREAFGRGSAISTLSAILRDEPRPVHEFVAGVPSDIEGVISRCVRKDPARRFQVIADAKIALEDLLESPERLTPASSLPARKSRRAMAIAAAGVAAVLFAGVLFTLLFLTLRDAGAPWQHFTPFATEAMSESYPAWSPDGSALAYLAVVDGVTQVFARGLDSPTAMQLTRAPAYCSTPYWSRSGDRIYYTTSGGLWSVGAAGGESRLVLPDIRFATLTPDGKQFVFFRGPLGDRGLFIAPVSGGAPQPYRHAPFPERLVDGAFLAFSPDGSRLAAVISRHSGTSGELWILPWPSGVPRRALPSLPVASYVRRFSWMPDNRRLVFEGEFPGVFDMHLYIGDTQTGKIEPITSGTGQERQPSVSPDGRRIALASGSENFDLLEVPLNGGAAKPLLASSRKEEDPAWSPAGKQYAYVTNASGASELWLRNVSDDWARPVLARRSEAPWPWYRVASPRISPDNQRIAYDVQGAQHAIWISTVGGGRPVTLDPDTGDCHSPSWSPDGNWIAYRRLYKGKWELVKKPLGGGAAVRLANTMEGGTVGDGGMTDWSPTGDWIAHSRSDALYLVSPDGAVERPLDIPKPDYFGFSKDGSRLYTIHRGRDRRWEAVAIEIRTGAKHALIPLPIPPEARVHGFSVRPDDTSFAISVGANRFDIWILENFQQPANWWTRLFQR